MASNSSNNNYENENENIFFSFSEEKNKKTTNFENVEMMLKDFEQVNNHDHDYDNGNDCDYDYDINDMIFAQLSNYEINYNIKQLIMIYEYYESHGLQKMNKNMKKADMIHEIVIFENNPKNYDILIKRLKFWNYMDELKVDKFMKKYVIW